MEQKKQLPIGKLLEKFGYIGEKEIQVALRVQKANPMFLGEILQSLDFVTASEIAEAMAMQYETEYINLDTEIISDEALSLIPYDVAESKEVLPVKIVDNELMMATENINDLLTIDYLNKLVSMPVKFVVADKNKIKRAIQLRYYQLENPIEEQIKSIIADILENRDVNVINFIELILNNAIKDKATDIHITPDEKVIYIFFRIDGVLHHYYAIPKSIMQQIVSRIKIISKMDIAEHRLPQDGGFSHEFLGEKYDFRVSSIPTDHGENIVTRILSGSTASFNLHHLGFEDEDIKKLKEIFNKPYGIVLVTGPTGSGKTTTLYSLLRQIDFIEKNILTIEDPIEYKFSFVRQTQVNEQAGYSFSRAIRHFMRQDPDVMLVGEMRDEETADLALKAAITGHLVLSTLHTNDAISAIPRLLGLGIKDYMLGSALLAILAQRLVRRLCNNCKKEKIVHKEELINIGCHEDLLKSDEIKIYEANGCEYCKNTGYLGREAIIEILSIDEEIKNMISLNKNIVDILAKARENGMSIMKENAMLKILKGITTIEEIKRVIL